MKKSDRSISSQSKIVSHHCLTLEIEKKKKTYPGTTSHFVKHKHSAESCGSRNKAIFNEAVRPGQCRLTTQSMRGLKRWNGVWGRVKKQHLSALISMIVPLSRALNPLWIQWCCSVEDYGLSGQLTDNTGYVYMQNLLALVQFEPPLDIHEKQQKKKKKKKVLSHSDYVNFFFV